MALGTQSHRKGKMFVAWDEIPKSPGHVFYDRLQDILSKADSDSFVEKLCASLYFPGKGRPSIPPGRPVLSWRLSNTTNADSYVAALDEATNRHGVPEIFIKDQGPQFTGYEFIRAFRKAGVRISMDGRGRGMVFVMVERLWRWLKYECVYSRELEAGERSAADLGLLV